jgi:hypothetical protein
MKGMKTSLEKTIQQRMDEIEAEMRAKTTEILTIAKEAKDNCDQTLIQATEAAQASEKSAQKSKKSMKYAQQLVQSTEERRQELQMVADRCENMVKTTTTEQKELFERNLSEIRTGFQQEFDRNKQATTESVANAKESARAAKDVMSSAREVEKTTKEQLETQRMESKKIVSDAQEAHRQSERSAHISQEAERKVTWALDAMKVEESKLNDMYKRLQEALQRVEKLEKKYESRE